MNPFPLLLALFILVPLLEIYLLIVVGGWIGAIPTVFMVVFTAVLGALLLRHQGLAALHRARGMLGRGELPALELLEGVLLLFGGALLLTPGFFTDTFGFLCLVPPLRRRVVRALLERYARSHGFRPPPSRGGFTVIDGEFRREDD